MFLSIFGGHHTFVKNRDVALVSSVPVVVILHRGVPNLWMGLSHFNKRQTVSLPNKGSIISVKMVAHFWLAETSNTAGLTRKNRMYDYPGYIPCKALWNACSEIFVKVCKLHSYSGSLNMGRALYTGSHFTHTTSYSIILDHFFWTCSTKKTNTKWRCFSKWSHQLTYCKWAELMNKATVDWLATNSPHFCFDVRHCWILFYMTKHSLDISVKKYMAGLHIYCYTQQWQTCMLHNFISQRT